MGPHQDGLAVATWQQSCLPVTLAVADSTRNYLSAQSTKGWKRPGRGWSMSQLGKRNALDVPTPILVEGDADIVLAGRTSVMRLCADSMVFRSKNPSEKLPVSQFARNGISWISIRSLSPEGNRLTYGRTILIS